jgi:hypothetical protein
MTIRRDASIVAARTALSSYISRIPLDRRTRADLMGDRLPLYPAILNLGPEDAGRRMVGEMGRICKQ